MTPICPHCEAERALRDMRAMYDWEPHPDVNVYAHAAGMAEGSFTLLLDHPLELCERHKTAKSE
jgi:hypothetical protein